jgi:dihydropyrimidinase
MLDLIIRGGMVVTPQAVGEMDVGVQGEKIVAVGWPGTLASGAGREINARGKIVIPGGIEPHAHIGIPVPEHSDLYPQVAVAEQGRELVQIVRLRHREEESH